MLIKSINFNPEIKSLRITHIYYSSSFSTYNKSRYGMTQASWVVQWLRIHLPMQGTWVQSLVQEDPTYHGAVKPVHHKY